DVAPPAAADQDLAAAVGRPFEQKGLRPRRGGEDRGHRSRGPRADHDHAPPGGIRGAGRGDQIASGRAGASERPRSSSAFASATPSQSRALSKSRNNSNSSGEGSVRIWYMRAMPNT